MQTVKRTSNEVIFASIDVDDQAFNVAVQKKDNITHFKCAPSAKVLVTKLKNKGYDLKNIRLCYEATYFGFSLKRDFDQLGIHCDIIAPSSILQKTGKRVKTDRLDALKLVKDYGRGDLAIVYTPTKEDEAVRSLIRSRLFLSKQMKQTKRHILSICRHLGWNYRKEIDKPNASYFTQPHLLWLKQKIKTLSKNDTFRFTILTMLSNYNSHIMHLDSFNNEIEAIAQKPKYQKKVKALGCIRGLDTLSAMSLIAEIIDIKRFSHPKYLTSFAGLDISEYSSGGKEKRFSITKQGNRFIRTLVAEATQYAFRIPNISRKIQDRRKGVDPRLIDIGDRCMHRLYKKSTKLIFRGKPRNKIKIACAREMLGFIWESLKLVS